MKELNDKEIRQMQLDILKSIAEFCRVNHLRYSLAYGSLLGAIRHHGYIPWDDDIDLWMPREDFNRFVQEYENDRMPYKVGYYYTDARYPYMFAKVYNSKTIVKEDLYFSYKMGVFIDVFPMDIWNDSGYNAIRILNYALRIKTYRLSKKRKLIKNIAVFVGKIILLPVSLTFIRKMIEHIRQDNSKMNESVGYMLGIYKHREKFKRIDLFERLRQASFEDISVCIPSNYDSVLSQLYGDYMTLPPKEKQITHHYYIAYRGEE